MLSNVLPLALSVCLFEHPDHVQRLCQPVIDAAVRELVVAAGDAPVYQHRAHAGVVGTPDVKEAVADHDRFLAGSVQLGQPQKHRLGIGLVFVGIVAADDGVKIPGNAELVQGIGYRLGDPLPRVCEGAVKVKNYTFHGYSCNLSSRFF